MTLTGSEHDTAAWEVLRPWRTALTGIDMAGFGVPGSPPGGLRIVPHPSVMLVVEFGPNPSTQVTYGAESRQRGGFIAGPGFGYGGTARAWGENVTCVQVRLSPPIAGAILGLPLSELDDTVVAIDDALGPDAARFGERLAQATAWDERFAVTEAMIMQRRAAGPSVAPEVNWAWNRIVESRGRIRVERLADELGWSRKRLWSRFDSQVGLTPKRAARLVRFDRAARLLAAGRAAARVAAETGYSDQSHLHRDVMAFAAATPAAMTGEPFLAVDDRAWPGHPKQVAT